MTSTLLRVLVLLRLLYYGQNRGTIPPAPLGWRNTDLVHTRVVITTPTIREDVSVAGEPKSATGFWPLVARVFVYANAYSFGIL